MRTKLTGKALALSALAMCATPAFAQQTMRDFEAAGQSDVRAVASVTIPLGGPHQSGQATSPRVDFAVINRRYQTDGVREDLSLAPELPNGFVERRTALSFTLERNPRMLLNGRRIATLGPVLTAQDNESADGDSGGGGDTVLYVVGGLVVLGGLTAIVVEQADEVFEAPLRELEN